MIETIGTIASITPTIIATGITIIQTIRAEKKSKSVELAKIVQKLPEFINQAEQIHGEKTGAAKLQYVLREVYIECLKNGIKFQEEPIKVEIEKILSTPQKKEN